MVNAQEWLDENYPKEERKSIKELDLRNKNLIGDLDLNGFDSLEVLNCSYNRLTFLKFDSCGRLKKFDCENNQLIQLDLTNLARLERFSCRNNNLKDLSFLSLLCSEQLTYLNIRNNSFFEQDLSIFSKFVNLESLRIGNHNQEENKKNIYNYFAGSLEPLKNMSKLKRLDIRNTDIDSGLEYLPESIKEFKYLANERKDSKCKTIEEKLKPFNNDLEKWKEFNGSAHEWLSQNYPENDVCQKKIKDKGWDNSDGWDNKGKKRVEITKLDISKQELNGGLKLKGFIKLEKLNCSNNQLTNLDLSDCSNLVELKCDKNKLINLDFLKNIKKIKKLWVQNNLNLADKNLNFLISLVELKELDISDCPKLKGSLKPFENLAKLEWLDISNTDIKEGLGYLPVSCKNFYCELDYQHGSVEIAKKLSKFSEEDEKSNHTKYNLDKWKIDKANNSTTSIIPLERLFVIRGNLKQFINKWGKEHENDWYEWLKKKVKCSKGRNNELIELQSPKEARWDKGIIIGSRTLNNALAASGIILSFQGNNSVGAGLLGVYPVTEFVITNLEKSLEKRETKWNEFLADADTFSDNFNELLGITKSIKTSERGKINKMFRDLKEKVGNFLESYDQLDENGGEKNGEIDLEELISQRAELAQDLKDTEKGKLWEIVKAMKQLEDKIIAYRQGDNVEEETISDNFQAVDNKNQNQTVINLVDNRFEPNQSLNSSSANLLNKDIELQNLSSEQQTQIIHNSPKNN